jgi:hypothetical protein
VLVSVAPHSQHCNLLELDAGGFGQSVHDEIVRGIRLETFYITSGI